jgi:hypothetical protein
MGLRIASLGTGVGFPAREDVFLFSTISITALELTQLGMKKGVRAAFQEEKRPGPEADQ